MPFSQIFPPSPSPTESIRLFYTSVSLLLSRTQGYCYHLSKFHVPSTHISKLAISKPDTCSGTKHLCQLISQYPLASRVAQGVSGPSSSCVWNPRVFADDARGWQCPFVLCLHVPHPEPSSLLPPHTLPLGRPSAPAPSIQYRASNLD